VSALNGRELHPRKQNRRPRSRVTSVGFEIRFHLGSTPFRSRDPFLIGMALAFYGSQGVFLTTGMAPPRRHCLSPSQQQPPRRLSPERSPEQLYIPDVTSTSAMATRSGLRAQASGSEPVATPFHHHPPISLNICGSHGGPLGQIENNRRDSRVTIGRNCVARA